MLGDQVESPYMGLIHSCWPHQETWKQLVLWPRRQPQGCKVLHPPHSLPPPRMANAGGGKSHSLAWMSDICLVVPRPFFHYQIKGNKRQFLVPTPNASQKYNFSICALKSVGLVFLSHGLAAKWQLFGFLNNDSLLWNEKGERKMKEDLITRLIHHSLVFCLIQALNLLCSVPSRKFCSGQGLTLLWDTEWRKLYLGTLVQYQPWS